CLFSDLETFLTDVLKGETLSKKAKEKKDAFIKRIKDVLLFKDSCPAQLALLIINKLNSNIITFCLFKSGVQQSPPVAAQELQSILKSGFLEKRRKDHSFFGNEWQKRWCALSNNIFYYYGSEKDKQQKGEFNIVGYTVKMNNTLRKDAKRDCCFEISAPDKRVYQFCAASEKDAKEWVEHIDFLIKDMGGVIPEDEEEYDDCLTVTQSSIPAPIDDDIYEELPEEDTPQPAKPTVTLANKPPPLSTPMTAVNKSTDYANYFQGLWDCAGDHPDELSFKRGDTIYILSKEYDLFGWWVGEMKGAIGIVPKEYLLELYLL
uniref:Src kinase-associated phosphoprotein 2 n=1 Tax=Sinocyclocheilus anshuiensis TaxID=1608454 RepID=A0A671L1B2_9TELE